MRMIQALDLLTLWERGSSRHALDRSALLCAWARPELPVDTIADLPLGEVTSSLLRLRAALFGERIQAHVDCENCGERLELTIGVRDLLQPGTDSVSRDVDAAGLRFRPPCLRDLSAIVHERDAAQGARQLLARCLVDGVGGSAALLSEMTVREVEDALEAADPNADLAFDVRCEACGHLGTAQLDAGDLLWDEVDCRARALLTEVHLLARAYGWTESEILALSAERRASYLSLVAP
ncbi:MAG: hypothetical protein JWO04_2121 [Gammaproteobacteria bacterium]|jgi:hypothetical protein|nr:hypothetical protein [Gammaproteobacteria bacterium]